MSLGSLAGDFAVARDSTRNGVLNSWRRGCDKYILGIGHVCGGGEEVKRVGGKMGGEWYCNQRSGHVQDEKRGHAG